MNNQTSRKLFLMRHGERVDYVFPQWLDQCFDKWGTYTPKDLNMPETVPKRSAGHAAFAKDSPLSKIGIFQARITGEAFEKTQFDVEHAYCSPSLRCIQTLDAFLEGCNRKEKIKIKIEPGLFEFLAWHVDMLPDWMTIEELVEAGYNVDTEYTPIISTSGILAKNETTVQFYNRNAFVTEKILKETAGNVLFAGHSVTPEVCSRQLVGKKPRTYEEMGKIAVKVPYCYFLQVEQKKDKWEISDDPLSPLTHSSNTHYRISLK